MSYTRFRIDYHQNDYIGIFAVMEALGNNQVLKELRSVVINAAAK